MHRHELLRLLRNHRTRFIDEAGYVQRAIRYVEEHENCFYRDLWPMHVTGSAWVVSPDRSQILMMHHKKHDQWFQLGGHADGDADIVRVALRETSEETGLDLATIKLIHVDLFDVDIHSIPAMHNEPEHYHIDIRFLVEIDNTIPVPGNDESHQVLWVNLHQVSRFNNNRSTFRMREKTRHLHTLLENGYYR